AGNDGACLGLARGFESFGDFELSLLRILVGQRSDVETIELAIGIGVKTLADVEVVVRDKRRGERLNELAAIDELGDFLAALAAQAIERALFDGGMGSGDEDLIAVQRRGGEK